MSAGRLSPDYPSRTERLRAWLAAARLPGAVLLGCGSATYLTGYSRYNHVPSGVIVDRAGSVELFVSYDEAPIATGSSTADSVFGYGEHGFGLDARPVDTLVAAIADRRREVFGAQPIGYASELGDFSAQLGETVAADGALRTIRLRKDPDERAMVERAFSLALIGQTAVRDAVAVGVTEIELFSVAHSAPQLSLGEPVESATDLLAGQRSSAVCWPAAVAGSYALVDGDVVVSDISIAARGYWGDTARTFVLGANDEALDVVAQIGAVLELTAERLVPGTTGHEIHAAMRDELASRFPRGEFPHHGGHGIGLTGYEDPHLVPGDRLPLETGMLIAVEPGIYFPGRFGVRLENIYEVTEEGGVPLSLRAAPESRPGLPR